MEETVRSSLKRRIKRRMAGEKPTVWIGKGGIGVPIVDEIKKQLKAQGNVKVKVLKAVLREKSMEDVASEVAEKTGSELIEVRGHTFILHKPKGSKKGL